MGIRNQSDRTLGHAACDDSEMTQRANSSNQAARLARSPANAALPVRVASDIVSKKSDCRTGLLFPAV
jgi:hypothetical protein